MPSGTVSGSTDLFILSCCKGVREEKLSEMLSAHAAKWEKVRFFRSFCYSKINTNVQRHQHRPLLLYGVFHEWNLWDYFLLISFHCFSSGNQNSLKKNLDFFFLHSCETLCCHCEGIIMPMLTLPVAEYTVNLVPNYKHVRDSMRIKAVSKVS